MAGLLDFLRPNGWKLCFLVLIAPYLLSPVVLLNGFAFTPYTIAQVRLGRVAPPSVASVVMLLIQSAPTVAAGYGIACLLVDRVPRAALPRIASALICLLTVLVMAWAFSSGEMVGP